MNEVERDACNWRRLVSGLKRLELVRPQDGWGRDLETVGTQEASDGALVQYHALLNGVAAIRDDVEPRPGLTWAERQDLENRARNLLARGDWIGCKASAVLALLDEIEQLRSKSV